MTGQLYWDIIYLLLINTGMNAMLAVIITNWIVKKWPGKDGEQ